MSEQYTAYFVRRESEYYTLEVVYPPPEFDEGIFPEFRLTDKSRVRIIHDPEHPWEGQWGEARAQYDTKSPQFASLENIEVIEGIWECDPKGVVHRIEELTDKVKRRNRQIEDLRDQLAGAKMR